MKEYSFKIGGGRTLPNGKPNWPNRLNLVMSRKRALELISTLANMIRYSEEDEDIEYDVEGEMVGVGKMYRILDAFELENGCWECEHYIGGTPRCSLPSLTSCPRLEETL